ncbi:MAG: MFS transporter, partial [Anaerolineae bacterium]|nr:MFS transporter [Anaerolineae bacterium]
MLKQASLRHALAFMRGNMLVLTGTGVLGMFARGMVFPYASLYVLALGGQPAQIGWLDSLVPLAGLLVFPIAGYLADHTGRVRLIGLAGLLSASIFLIFMFAQSWQWLVVGSLLRGFMVIQFPP